ncbi:hypothetical protein [Novosphingobium nitrogenifigens]|nr:hypothetical protein [Novosphingobium nitrogenifigens]
MKRLARMFAMVLGVMAADVVGGRPALADPAPFDLAGPSLQITVTRRGTTLPIAAVPQLSAGDKVHVQVLLPATETAHYLMVAAFLRDPTNPPPEAWFSRSETWRPAARGGGPLDLTVPPEAQHLAVFLAPATGGDFVTLRKAVMARPGAFIRAAQDLEQASLDRGRFDAYLAAIRKVSATSPETLAHDAPIIASSLRIKINEECLQRQSEFQAACLLDTKQSVVLGGDGAANATSLTGAATDLAMSLAATPAGGLGYYSPYISTIREIVGIFGAMHTARYQYIPALGVPDGDRLGLVLNTPPSFADPKSVLMATLPEIKPSVIPTSHMPAAAVAPCLGAKGLGAKDPVLPLAVSPLFYATGYAHDLKLRLRGEPGVELPLTPDPVRGGLAIGANPAVPAKLTGPISGVLRGMWGFEPFSGPEVTLQTAGDWHWDRKESGRDDGPLVLTGAASACVASVTVAPAKGKPQPVAWKVTGTDSIGVTLPATADRHDALTVSVNGPDGTAPAVLVVAPPARALPPAARIVAKFSDLPPPDPAAPLLVQLDGADEIAANARLSFTLKADPDARFTGREAVEIGTTGSDATVRLTVGNGLTLVDPTVLVASLNPAQVLGASAYGPLRARLMRGDVAGDWLGVGTLVRLPTIRGLDCPADPAARCLLRGEALYLMASVAATREFDNAANVPDGYPGTTLSVPRVATGAPLFVRLHDAPEIVNRIAAPVVR